MQPPSGGDSFVGNDGITYTAATGVIIEVGQGGVQLAFTRKWTEQVYPGDVNVQVPLTGFSLVIPNQSTTYVLNPAGTLATGTITFPPNPVDGRRQGISTSQTVTTLTLAANAGQSIIGTAATLTAIAPLEFVWVAALSSWVRR